MSVKEIIEIAREHSNNGAAMMSSAKLCLSDAESLYNAGNLEGAKARAIKSLAYSVGVFSADYQKCVK